MEHRDQHVYISYSTFPETY